MIVFANVCHFHPSRVFAGKAGAYQSEAPIGTELYVLPPSLEPAPPQLTEKGRCD
jgi:hypothetical protein